MKKKLTTFAALLAMLLTASAPLVQAQQAQPSDVPADSGVTPTLVTPAAGSAVGCQVLYGFPTAFCMVNEEGLIALPDGSTAPVVVQPDGSAFTVDENGNLTLIGTSAPPTENPAGATQYNNAQGQPQAPISGGQ